MLRAFGDREHCRRLWALRPERNRRRAKRPLCSTQFTNPKPYENGEMHVAVGEGVRVRRVRISFRGTHSGAADRRYYTVRDITLAARCICHGHAHACLVTRESARCVCERGTCGDRCEQCCNGGRCDAAADTRCPSRHYATAPGAPCSPCPCHPDGSEGECEWDATTMKVRCRCVEGVTGPACDTCVDERVLFPACLTEPRCRCDPRGILRTAHVCDHVCHCKAHVTGDRCDRCAAGHFGLSEELEEGCLKCYCSGVSDICTTDTSASDSITIPANVAGEWRLIVPQTNLSMELTVDETGRPYMAGYEVEGSKNSYWSTNSVVGDRVSWYGGVLRYAVHWDVQRGDAGGVPLDGHDVLLAAQDGTTLAYATRTHRDPGKMSLEIPLRETNWYKLGDEPIMATRRDMMHVLARLQSLMLRATFHLDQEEVRMEAVEIIGTPGVIEQCTCPPGYEGPSCTRCSWTHVPVTAADALAARCVPCDCNGHARCDPVSGECGECTHNTTGPNCSRCAPGHYGDPARGPCLPCACPLLDEANNFSPNCALAGDDGEQFVCTQCPLGYIGDHCETCDVGYWGAPSRLGGSCAPCECGGAACDPLTGDCALCPEHAVGLACDTCQEGYYYSNGACIACECGTGSLSTACEADGRCACAVGWSGYKCSSCATGHGDVSAGCPRCRCGVGAVSSGCDAESGECGCSAGAAPPYCDTCVVHHYNLTTSGCIRCNCTSVGAVSAACDIRTGQCRCKEHVTGRTCDICQEGYYGLHTGGCRRCRCVGGATCDPDTGHCSCPPGVGGDRCDTCLPGHYGLGPHGCLPCRNCSAGELCDTASGRCVCPARSRGAGCGQCAPGAWRDGTACRQCGCGPGAVAADCDSKTGQCRCRGGWTGRTCSRCSPGHYGPRCRPCGCKPEGTADCDPETGTCPCDDEGRCRCKANVVGEKCSSCRMGTFSLSSSPAGCTECYCFGRSVQCTQAGLTRTVIRSPAVTLHRTRHHHGIHVIRAETPDGPSPVYLELGDGFFGDRVTSYGGSLRYTIQHSGGEPDNRTTMYPLVLLHGNHGLVLEYYQVRVSLRYDAFLSNTELL